MLANRSKKKVPTVLTLHGGHFTIPDDEQQQLTTNDLPGKGIEWGRALSWWWKTRQLLHNVDAVVCVGFDEYQAVRKALPKQRVECVPGGHNPARFAAADATRGRAITGLPENAGCTIVCCARLDAQKDQLTLVQAWNMLRRRLGAQAAPVNLVLVGPETTKGYRAKLEAAIDHDLPGACVFTGGISAADVADVLASADMAVLPSRHEPFGLSVVEAWATGLPLVASRWWPCLVSERRAGWHVV